MNIKASLKAALTASEKWVKRNGPTILMGVGVGLMVGGTVTAVAATTKAVPKVAAENSKRSERGEEKMTKLQICASCWKLYAPSFIMTLAGASFVVGANHMNLKRIAAASALAQLNEQKLREYKEAAQKALGTKEAQKIDQQAAEDKVRMVGPIGGGNYPGKGPTLCQDCMTNQRFWSSKPEVERAVNEINARVINGERQNLNDFLYMFGLEECKIGNEMGWEPDSNGLYDPNKFRANFQYVMDEITGDPILLVEYEVQEFLPF